MSGWGTIPPLRIAGPWSLRSAISRPAGLLQQGDTAGAAKLFSSISQIPGRRRLPRRLRQAGGSGGSGHGKAPDSPLRLCKLGSHSYCTQALEQINSLLLEQAKERAQAPDLNGALEILDKLGSYKGSDILAERCRKMLDWAAAPEGGRLLTEERRYMPDKLENVYLCDEAYIVVPEVLDSSTGFFIYFPGGRDEEMSVDYLLYYMMNPSPNTLAVFMARNGLEDMEAKTGRAVEILDRAAAECGLFPGTWSLPAPAWAPTPPCISPTTPGRTMPSGPTASSPWTQAPTGWRAGLLSVKNSAGPLAELGTDFLPL